MTADYFSMSRPAYEGVLPERSANYLANVASTVQTMAPSAIAERVERLVHDYEAWRRTEALNLMAAENVMSRGARRLLDSDLATRVTEGFPGAKEFPPGRHNVQVDEIEGILIALATQLFQATFVEWRVTSTTMANAVALWAMTQPGDALLVQSMEGGGNMNYQSRAVPGLRGLAVHAMPPAAEFDIDVDAVREIAARVRPRVLVIGGSQVLFPYPVKELRSIADDVGAHILFDAAHVGMLIAAGEFPHPLVDGATVLSMGTQKINGGPVGGLAFTNDPAIARAMLALTFPSFLQTRDLNKYAAAAYALAEMRAFGGDYARQVVANARALGAALDGEGFIVLGKRRGYTATHQIFLDVRAFGAPRFELLCQAANILVHKSHMCGDAERGVRTGIRISVQEATRQGMREPEMARIAWFIRRATVDGVDPVAVSREIREFVRPYGEIRFAFDTAS